MTTNWRAGGGAYARTVALGVIDPLAEPASETRSAGGFVRIPPNSCPFVFENFFYTNFHEGSANDHELQSRRKALRPGQSHGE